MTESLEMRVRGADDLPTLVYLPGMHGDWTLVTSFRLAVAGRARWVEFTYPRTLSWTLTEYAQAIIEALLAHQIHHGWLVGESFGSQIAWELIRQENLAASRVPSDGPTADNFRAEGLILAGGFVRHPAPWGVWTAHFLFGQAPRWARNGFLKILQRYAVYRHRHAPETMAGLAEFLRRRTDLDWAAARHRLRLIAENDPRSVARQTRVPVYYLAGLVDPLVPWPLVRFWLSRHCPGYRRGRTFWRADHNVLGTAPQAAAQTVLTWLSAIG
jgi:pimeloyl-ACP methyl ester carboxylesterase